MVTVEVTYGEADYVRVLKFMTRRPTLIFNFVILLGAVVLALLLYRSNQDTIRWLAIPIGVVLLVLLSVLITFIQRWNIARQLKSAPGAQGQHVWVLTDDGIRISGALTSADIKWEAIIRARESKGDFLFYTSKRFAQFLPKRVFTSDEQVRDLRQLIVDKLGNKAEMI